MRKLFKTVAIVTVFSVCEKFLGFLYRVYLSRTIGEEGVGMYQVALSVFAFLLTVSCSGTPITVSRLMTKYLAENKKDKVDKVITAGITLTLSIALLLFFSVFVFKGLYSKLFADERCYNIFLIVMPGLIFTSVYAVLRGVFWGRKDFMPYSIIELLEEICMIVVGVFLINKATSIYQGAYRAGVAVLISYIFSFSVATLVFFLRKNKLKNPFSEFKPLISCSTPVTAMRTINSLAISLVSIILPMRLVSAGFTQSEALSLFGSAVGQAIPLLFIPTSLIGSFTLVIIPEISENYYKKQGLLLKNNIEKAIKFTVFLTCLFIPVFFVCGEEIGLLIFGSVDCGKYLTASAYLMLFIGLNNITTSILNSLGYETRVLIYCTVSGVFMIASIWILPKFIGIYSLLIGFTFVYGLTTLLNIRLMIRKVPYRPHIFRFITMSVAFIIPSALLGLMLEKTLLPVLGTVFTLIVCSGTIFAFSLALFYGFGLVDMSFMSKLSFFKKQKRNKFA